MPGRLFIAGKHAGCQEPLPAAVSRPPRSRVGTCSLPSSTALMTLTGSILPLKTEPQLGISLQGSELAIRALALAELGCSSWCGLRSPHCEDCKVHLSGTTAVEFISRFTRSGGSGEFFWFIKEMWLEHREIKEDKDIHPVEGRSEGRTDASLSGYYMEPTPSNPQQWAPIDGGCNGSNSGLSEALLECPWFSWPIK